MSVTTNGDDAVFLADMSGEQRILAAKADAKARSADEPTATATTATAETLMRPKVPVHRNEAEQ